MQITHLELIPVYATREMGKTAPGDPEKAVSHHLVVLLHTDAGTQGLGEMSDVPWELTRTSVAQLQARLQARLQGSDPFNLNPIMAHLAQEEWAHQVLCGVDIALHDLVARTLEWPLYRLLGGRFRDRIPFAYPLAPCQNAADAEANLKRIAHLLDQGHPTIRYYFGAHLDTDEAFLEEMRRRWGDAVRLNALDASGRFDVETAIAVIERFAPFHPGLVESPVRGRHEAPTEDFLAVKGTASIPISEHIGAEAIGERLARHRAIDVFNTGLGYAGIHSCRRMFALAELSGLKALMGSTVELSIGTAARVHVAAAVPNLDFPCYMAGPLVYEEQIVRDRVVYEEGYIRVPEGPGLGVELDREKLAAQRLW